MAITKDEMHQVAKAAFDRAENPLDQDAVLSEMFSGGIPFGKLKVMYKTVGIGEGFIPDPAVVKESTVDSFDSMELDEMETWEEVEAVIDSVMQEVAGSTSAQVLRQLKGYCSDADITLPKKTTSGRKPRQRGGAVTRAMVEYARVTDTKDFTPHGLYDVILPHVKGPKNAFHYASTFASMILAIKQGITSKDADALIKQMPPLRLMDVIPASE